MNEMLENELAACAVAGMTKAVLLAIEDVRSLLGSQEQVFFNELEEALHKFEKNMKGPQEPLN